MIFHNLCKLSDCYNINTEFLHNSLNKQLKNASACGMSIVYGGEAYYEIVGATDDTKTKLCDVHTQFPLSSLTKIVTGLMIELMVQDGIISYSDTIEKLCPRSLLDDLRLDASVTIEMLMSHQSGMLNGKISHYSNFYVKGLEAFVKEDLSKIEVVNQGSGCYYYSDVAINFLGYLCECVTHTSFQDLVERYVLAPLELKDTCFPSNLNARNTCSGILKYNNNFINLNSYRDNPSFYPSNQLYSSLFDISKLLQYFLNNYKILYHLFEPLSSMSSQRLYCRSWAYERYKDKNVFFHHGADYGVMGKVYIIPSENVAIAMLTNSESIGYSERVIHYLLNKVHLNAQKDPILIYDRVYKDICYPKQQGFYEAYLSVSGKARKLSFLTKKNRVVMIFQSMGFSKYETYIVRYSEENRVYEANSEDGESERIQIIRWNKGRAGLISYKGCFYEAVTSYEKKKENRELFIGNLGVYEGILEYQFQKEKCELLQLEDGSLQVKFQYSSIQVFPHPAKSNVFLSTSGIISFDIIAKNVAGFTMKSFLKFLKVE